jgi:hypothetical protein
MAIYRLHRKQWEKGYGVVPIRVKQKTKAKAEPLAPRGPKSIGAESVVKKASKATTEQRKGASSGLSTVVRRRTKAKGGTGGTKIKWWSELSGTKSSSKGHISVTV